MARRIQMVVTGLLIGLATGMLGGCAEKTSENIVLDSSQAAEVQTSLTFFGFKYEPLNVIAIEEAMHSFMNTSPWITISYDGIKSPEYFDVLEKRLATGHGDDIIMVDHERVLELGSCGRLADLSGLSTLDNFCSLAKTQMTAGNRIDYVPTSISAFGLYCNLDLLKAHDQKVPENLAELEAVCDYFVSQGITPIVANNDISLKTIVIAKGMLPFYQQADPIRAVTYFNEEPDALAEALRPGFALVEDILERGWVNPEEALSTAKTKDDLVLFAQGGRPFMLTGAWAVPRVRELEPDFRFAVCPYPILDDGSVMVINVDTRISILADSPNQAEAMQFVEYLTQQDVMWNFVDSQCSFSPLNENRLAEDEAIQSLGPYLNNGRSVIGSDDNLQFPIWDITRQCVIGILEGDDTQTAVDTMKELLSQWNRLFGGDQS